MSSFDFQDSKLDSDKELQAALQQEQAKAHFQSQIHKLTDTCWDTCFDKPRDKMDSRTETCISNCVDRFIDTSLLVANRFQQILQRAASQ